MRRRVLALALALVLALGLVPMGVLAAEPEEVDPSVVTGEVSVGTAAELAALGGQDIVGNITLTANIDMSATTMEPIKSLKGCFNGDGYTISNLTLKGDKGSYNYTTGFTYVNTGLIGELDGSVINLKMTGVDITKGIDQYNNVGALVGKIADGSESKIDNCIVSGTITSTAGNGYTLVGALVGMMTGSKDDPTTLTINNCVSDVALTGASSTYIGGLLGSAQSYNNLTITKCAVLGSFSGKGTGGGMIGYISSADTVLGLSDSYLGGKMDSSKKVGIAYNLSKLSSFSCTNFYYDKDKNPDPYSWSKFEMLNKGGSVEAATGKTTDELKVLTIDGFAVSADFGGYPVPVWTPAAAPDPITPPAPKFSCALTFTGTEGGTVTVKDSEGTELTATDGVYTLTATGDYTYTVTFDEDTYYYNDVPATTFTVNETDTEMTIPVTLTYKTSQPKGDGTEASPYLIGTAAELRWLADQVNGGTYSAAYVKLTDDITVPGSWTPLGKNAAAPFSGHFDGAGHSVTITVDDPGLSYFGFFGCLSSKPDRESGTDIKDQPSVVVENLTVNGTVYCSEPYAYVGGLAGRALGKVEIKDCTNNATVSSLARGSAGVGGLIGGYEDGLDYVYWSVRMTVNGCTNNGLINVTGDNTNAMVGGLVGANKNCVQIADSKNTGTINAPGCTVGGLLGEAGAQTGDYVPSIKDCANTGTLIGAAGKTNNLYGKGTIRSDNVTNSGNNEYTGGSASTDELLTESQKYLDVLAVPATATVGYEVSLLKDGKEADGSIIVTCSQGAMDTNRDYLKIVEGKLQLAKQNTTGKVIEATATLTWSKDGKSLSKPVTVNIYPAASARVTLMNNIAATYKGSSSDWVVFDMAAYAKLDGTTSTTSEAAKTNYLNLTINELAGKTPLVTDRAKAEIILAALGIDSTKLTPYGSETAYSNAAKLASMDLGTSHYTAPWVLLAEQAGQLKLTDAQRNSMISLLTDSANLGTDGLFFTKWAGETFADPDTTGTALAALAKYADRSDVKTFIDNAVAGLSSAQRDNGSYGNVNSDAMVITGLTAIGIDPAADGRFVKGGCSLADALLLYVNDAGNGFTTGYVSGTQGEKAQALATEQGFRALVTLEQFKKASDAASSEEGKATAFNIYTLSTTQVDSTTWEPTTDPTPVGPSDTPVAPTPGKAEDTGKVPSQGGGTSGGSSTTSDWITVTLTIRSDSADWYAKSLRTAKDSTVQQVVEQAAYEADLTLDMDSKYGYLRAIVKDGVSLGQFDRGPNSGWMYKVNGEMPMVGMGDYKLTRDGEKILLYYVVDYTKEDTGGSFGGGSTTTLPTEPTTTCPFTDLTGHWSKDEVERAWTQGLVTGMTETTFVPDAGLTRAMAVTMLYRMAGSPAATAATGFTDVPAGSWYAQAVAWAAETGVVKGMTETTFAPDEAVTRAQLATMLYRYAQTKGEGYTGAWMFLLDVPDRAAIADWAYEAVCWLNTNDVLKGRDDGRIDPQGGATRAEAAALYLRLADKLA